MEVATPPHRSSLTKVVALAGKDLASLAFWEPASQTLATAAGASAALESER